MAFVLGERAATAAVRCWKNRVFQLCENLRRSIEGPEVQSCAQTTFKENRISATAGRLCPPAVLHRNLGVD